MGKTKKTAKVLEVHIVNSRSQDVGETQIFNKLFLDSEEAEECFKRLVREEDTSIEDDDIEDMVMDGYFDGTHSYIQLSSEPLK